MHCINKLTGRGPTQPASLSLEGICMSSWKGQAQSNSTRDWLSGQTQQTAEN